MLLTEHLCLVEMLTVMEIKHILVDCGVNLEKN